VEQTAGTGALRAFRAGLRTSVGMAYLTRPTSIECYSIFYHDIGDTASAAQRRARRTTQAQTTGKEAGVKVLYLSPYPPARDGIGNYTWTLATAMREAGVEIGVVVPRNEPGGPPEVLGAINTGNNEYTKLRSKIAQWNPDIIHVQFAIAGFSSRTGALMRYIEALRRDLQVPVVVTLHEFTRESALLPVAGPALYRRVASHCDHIIVHTDIALNSVVGRFGVPKGKVTVIPHPSARPPVATASRDDLRRRFALGDARVMLAFGFIHVDKGLDDLVRALGILRAAGCGPIDDYVLVVAGSVRPRQGLFRAFEVRDRLHLSRVMRLARRSGVRQRLVLTGYVPVGEVAAWFSLAEVVVLPYRRIEQSGVASLARSFPVPVLVSTAGGLAEQFADSSWTFPPRAPEQLAQTLERFLEATPAERMLPPVNGRPDDLAAVVARTLELYRTVTGVSENGRS
jgi:glycosyltransferase involved in cell wall biosynthesis